MAAIAIYLEFLAGESGRRGYAFNRSKFVTSDMVGKTPVTSGQVLCEWEHLKNKLVHRDPAWLAQISFTEMADTHPLFVTVDGTMEPWEKRL